MWEMGGYGCFIWSSYGIVFAGLILVDFQQSEESENNETTNSRI